MAATKEKAKLSMFDRYVVYRDATWTGRDLVASEAADDLLAMDDPEFFSEYWKERAVHNQATALVLEFERRLAKTDTSRQRVHVVRQSMPEVQTQNGATGVAMMAPPRINHVLAEVQTVTSKEWIVRLEKAKRETQGQADELRRLWGLMKKELAASERRKVEKHFRDDHAFQMFLNIEGIEEE